MKQRDIELLSSYLDGQLSSTDSTRLEARLRTEPDLRSVLQDLRGARSLLRQLPMRKAPRNFTLTPKMVGKNPPLPRSYPVFKFVASLAAILLFFTYSLNVLGPQLAAQPPVFGMGGGGAPDTTFESEAATESPLIAAAPAATEPPAASVEAATQEPSVAMAPLSTATAAAQDTYSTRNMETAVSKQSSTDTANAAGSGLAQEPPQVPANPAPAATISPLWQWLLAGIALLSLFIMAVMRQRSASRWRSKS